MKKSISLKSNANRSSVHEKLYLILTNAKKTPLFPP